MKTRGKKRILALVMTLALTLSLLPGTALAAGGSTGGFTVTGGTLNTHYSYADNTLTILTATPLTIANTDPGVATADRILVPTGVAANVTLSGVNIYAGGTACAFAVAAGGEANITLADGPMNTLKSGLNRAGLEVPTGAAVTIGGSGGLETVGGRNSNGEIVGAGIGGGNGSGAGIIAITGGTVTANGYRSVGPGDGGSDFHTYIRTVALGAGSSREASATNSLLPVAGSVNEFVVTGAVELPCDLTIESNQTLTIPEGATLTVPSGKTLTNNGEINGGGTLTGDGTFTGGGTYTLKVPLSSAAVTGIAQPVAGADPDTDAVSGSANYTAGAVTWSDGQGGPIGTFDYDTAYTASVTLTIQKPDICQFASSVAGTVNGEPAQVTGSGNTVTLTYEFPATGSKPAPTPTPTPPPTPNQGSDDSDDSPSPAEQAASKVDKAKDGDTVEISLPSNGKLDGSILESAAGKDVTLEINAGNGVSWIVNGKDIPAGQKLSDLNLKVDTKASAIPVTVINAVTGEQKVMQLVLSHNGAFPIPLTLRLDTGSENAGLFANLYYYNETTGKLEYQSTAEIGPDGSADIPFDHASSYAVVIDKESHAPAEPPFTDVNKGDWCYDAVAYVYQKGLMVGTTDTTFSPNGVVTRAQVWTVLARMAGQEVSGSGVFEQARQWAVENGVSDGTNPAGAVTRQQLVAMLYRYAQSAGMDVSVGENTNILSYGDAFDVAEWAIPAFQWACGAGVVSGTADNRLNPQSGATRAQLAAILMRFSERTSSAGTA